MFAVIMLKYSAGLTGLSPIKLKEADLNRDGAVDESDAVLLLRRTHTLKSGRTDGTVA